MNEESATIALRKFLVQKNVKSGKGPLTPAGLLKFVKRFEETGKLEDRARAGRPCLKDLSKRFFDKLPSVPNELITNQPAYDPAEPSSQKRPRALLEHEFINFPQAKRLGVQI
ncbi:hypothetical protein TNCV_3813241 [Trichonephila clavipes]|nr:hypothetical protein TNCV_3813241 [Trichonephila clavipes]